MRKIVSALIFIAIGSAITVSSATAGTATDALSTCLADNTTGRDRKEMARWIFAGMATHPEINNLSNISGATRDELDRVMASTFTRLITESCPAQAKLAWEKDGGTSIQTAFGVIGKLAMQELMSNPAVNSSFTQYSKYIDQNKINAVFSKK